MIYCMIFFLLQFFFQPGGSLFFTTINKTPASYVLGVLVAERVLRLVAPGTHDWKKFISPDDLIFMIENSKKQ